MFASNVMFGKAIADETRQEIMRHLCCVWLSVNDLVEKMNGHINQPTVSHHLKKLEDAHLVEVRQEGRQRFYTLNQEQVTLCCGDLITAFAPDFAGSVRESLAEIKQESTKMSVSNVTLQDVIQSRYGEIASGTAANCCGAGESCGAPLYDSVLVGDLPLEVTEISLGCGDPVTIAGLKAGEWVLDLGSGGGIDCFLASRQVGESGYVIGVDMTPSMLQRANASKNRMNITNVEFRRGQIEALPVVSESIDVVMSNCVINLAPDKRPVFSEAFRVLKQGGRISVSDIVTDGEFSPELRADTLQWAECVTGAIPVDEYVGMMHEAGFSGIEVVSKVDATGIVEVKAGMPNVYSARITACKA